MLHHRDLSPDECLAHLREAEVGRMAVSTPGGPHIVPLTYVLHDGRVVVRTSPWSVVGTHAREGLVAFEVDALDVASRSGWSVVVRGRGEFVTDPAQLAAVRECWPVPWAAGTRTLVVALPTTDVTGRSFGASSVVHSA